MANISLKFRPFDPTTALLLRGYKVNVFLRNQTIAQPYFTQDIPVDNTTVIPMGTINDADTVVEVEVWATRNGFPNQPTESKVVQISKAQYETSPEKSVSIKITEQTNPAGQVNRIVQPGWPRRVTRK